MPGESSGVPLSQLVTDLRPVLAHSHVPHGSAETLISSAEIIGHSELGLQSGALVLDTGARVDNLDSRAHSRWQRMGAVGVIVRAEPESGERADYTQLAAACLPVLVVSAEISWFQVASLVRERLTAALLGMDTEETALAGHDLTKVAEAVGALIHAPVIIQNPDFEVLAYSQHRQDSDAARAATVLARSLPPDLRYLLDEVSAIERVYDSDEPVYLELGNGMHPRLAVAVRSGQDIMGSMWAVVHGPVDDQRRSAFADAARVAALALLQNRSSDRARKTLRDGLMAVLLSNSHMAADAKARLGLASRRLSVLALRCANADGSDAPLGVVQQVAAALDLHLRAAANNSGATVIDGRVLAIVPDAEASQLRRSMDRFAGRMRQVDLIIGIGSSQESASDIQRSRQEAEAVIAALSMVRGAHRVASFDDAMLPITVMGLRDFYRRQEIRYPFGAVAKVVDYDRRTSSELLPTLRAYLSCLGDVGRTAEQLTVHSNTVRYRLGRLRDVSGLDYLDADELFMADVQLRLLELGQA